MVILVGGEKGGTGKTTLATNLATWMTHSGREVLLIDTDKQGSASAWGATRAQHPTLQPISVVSKYGDVFQVTEELTSKYENIILDAGGRDSRELRSALLVANITLIPIKASQLDLWTLENMNEKIALARAFNRKLVALAVLSMAPTNRQIRETVEAQELVGECSEIQLARSVVHERKSFRDAMRFGRGVIEMDNVKAAKEVVALGIEAMAFEQMASQCNPALINLGNAESVQPV